jgi:hypothetical protein
VESVTLQDTIISNSSKGGLSVVDSDVTIIKGEFEGNDAKIGGYPSARRNILCKGEGMNVLDVMSLKGGDGQEKNTSLWILNDGCSLAGLPTQRGSPFFIPILAAVTNTTDGSTLRLSFVGSLLLPCGLGIEVLSVDSDGTSETMARGSVVEK